MLVLINIYLFRMYSTSEIYFPNSIPWIGIKALVHWLLSKAASGKQTFFMRLSVYFSSATLPSTGYEMTKSYPSFKVMFTIKTRNHLGWKYMCPKSVYLIILSGTAVLQIIISQLIPLTLPPKMHSIDFATASLALRTVLGVYSKAVLWSY